MKNDIITFLVFLAFAALVVWCICLALEGMGDWIEGLVTTLANGGNITGGE